MGYFSNGSEGEHWEIKNCNVCANHSDERGCAVMDVHLVFNYDQLNKDNEQLREAMDMLIPRQDNGLYNKPCSMLRKVEDND